MTVLIVLGAMVAVVVLAFVAVIVMSLAAVAVAVMLPDPKGCEADGVDE